MRGNSKNSIFVATIFMIVIDTMAMAAAIAIIIYAFVKADYLFLLSAPIPVGLPFLLTILVLEMPTLIVDENMIEIKCYRYSIKISINDIKRVEDSTFHNGRRFLIIYPNEPITVYNNKRTKIKRKTMKKYSFSYTKRVDATLQKAIPKENWFVYDFYAGYRK